MRAAVIHEHGGPGAIRIEDAPVPMPGAGEILVRVHASSANNSDLQTTHGNYGDRELPKVMGRDGAGTVERVGSGIADELSKVSAPRGEAPGAGDPLTADVLDQAAAQLRADFDSSYGGFGGAPKFPPSMVLEFLLRHYARTRERDALAMATVTCERMARGGIYDQLAGGFARYSVDARWVEQALRQSYPWLEGGTPNGQPADGHAAAQPFEFVTPEDYLEKIFQIAFWLEERRRNAQANFDQTTRLYNGQNQRIQQLDQQLASAASEKLRREEETSALATQHAELTELRATAVAESARLTEEANALRAAMAELDGRLRTLRHETEALREQRAELTARAARLASDIEHIEATCLNDLAVEAASLREDDTIVRIRVWDGTPRPEAPAAPAR